MALNNKNAGLFTIRITDEANVTFIDGVLEVSGDLENVNAILTDVIFIPD